MLAVVWRWVQHGSWSKSGAWRRDASTHGPRPPFLRRHLQKPREVRRPTSQRRPFWSCGTSTCVACRTSGPRYAPFPVRPRPPPSTPVSPRPPSSVPVHPRPTPSDPVRPRPPAWNLTRPMTHVHHQLASISVPPERNTLLFCLSDAWFGIDPTQPVRGAHSSTPPIPDHAAPDHVRRVRPLFSPDGAIRQF